MNVNLLHSRIPHWFFLSHRDRPGVQHPLQPETRKSFKNPKPDGPVVPICKPSWQRVCAAIRTAHMSRSHWMCTHASQSAEFQLVPLRVPLLHLVPRAGKTCNVFVEEGYRDECAINQRKLKAAAAALARTCLFVI